MFKEKRVRTKYFRERRYARMNYIRQIKANGCCAHCGWKKHLEILNFHHIDPTTKRFDFSGSSVGNLGLATVQQEIDKCILLCPNCHQWLHFQESAIVDFQS